MPLFALRKSALALAVAAALSNFEALAAPEPVVIDDGNGIAPPNSDLSTTVTIDDATGTLRAPILTDGTASLSGGSLTGVNGFTATGTIQGGTLSDGTATLTGGDLSTTGTVTGGTLTDGTASLSGGALTGATNVATNTLSTTGDATVGGDLIVGGASNLTDLDLSGNLNVNGGATLNTLTSTGDSTVGANLAVTGSSNFQGPVSFGTALITNGINNTGQLTTTGEFNAQSTSGNARVSVSDGAASLVVSNTGGGQNGIVVGPTNTVITGGSGTTQMRVDDSGVTISGSGGSTGDLWVQGDTNIGGDTTVAGDASVAGDANVGGNLNVNGDARINGSFTVERGTNFDMGGNRIQNLAPGVAASDAATVGQVRDVESLAEDIRVEARRGVAIASAMEVLLPDPGKQFRVNLGGGYFNGETAVGLTGSGRINRDVAMYFGLGTDTAFRESAGKIGISYQW